MGVPWSIAGVALASVLVSAYRVWQEDLINVDGVLYLRMAERLATGDVSGALALYKWPFYPGLVAGLAPLTQGDLALAAHVLNALLALGVAASFVAAVGALGGDHRHRVVAACAVVLYPWLNDMRGLIIRDWGYWACHGLVVALLLWGARRGAIPWGWAASVAAVGGAFRIEGLLLAAVLAAVKLGAWHRLGGWLAVPGALVVLGLIASWWRLPAWPPGGRDWEVLTVVWDHIAGNTAQRLAALRDFLGPFADHYAETIYLVVLLSLLVLGVVTRLTLPGAWLVYCAWQRGLVPWNRDQRRILGLLLAFNGAVLTLQLLAEGFLTRRYPMALCLALLTLTPFAAIALWDRGWRGHRRLPRLALGVLVLYMAADTLVATGVDRRHVAAAGRWLAPRLAENEVTLYSNVHQLIFFAGGDSYHLDRDYSFAHAERALAPGTGCCHWIALRFTRHQRGEAAEWRRRLGEPVARFTDGHDDWVLIFHGPQKSTASPS